VHSLPIESLEVSYHKFANISYKHFINFAKVTAGYQFPE